MELKKKKFIQNEPLAIVGIGCRLPGGINDPEHFWNELCLGGDKITEVPGDRWDLKAYYDANREKPGKVYTRKGGFLEKISYFDPPFFGISPREASFMDPQQRLLLEVTWEALEDAGISPGRMAGSRVGVFIGLFMHDFENVHNSITERNHIGPHSATGMSTTIAANRLSYVFDFKGPSMIIDTACSSSLVAVHLACKSLLSGESEMAVAGGVNILLKPEMTIALCKGAFLSEDGYCKSFDASADGYVRSEGAGVVIIKRLSDALDAQDPIYALITGTAVNQDGKSDGLTVPDANAQMAVIRNALNNAGIPPSDIQYVEAHGTGTIVGDPIEARALGLTLSADRKDGDRLVIGSVKSNLGHTESAAGVTSLIKTCLMLKKNKIPPNLHFVTPNPNIPFDALKLRVPTSLEDWPDTHGKPKMAGVNSFGFGGTNAHVVLVEYPETGIKRKKTAKSVRKATGSPPAFVVPISAHSRESLDAVVKSYIQWLDKEAFNNKITLPAIGHCASLRKGHHVYRLAAVARSTEELSQLLEAHLDREKRTGMVYGQAREKTHKPAFVFSGMGPQWWGMGRQLYQKEPLFRKTIETCAKAFAGHTKKWNLLEELLADESKSRVQETQISQPCIFSVQAALYALWSSWGIKPDAITGHSVGEIAAYYAAGVLSLEDAVTVCYHRSRLQQLKAGHGGMLAVGISQREAENLVRQFKGKVSIAAVNSHVSLTLAGDIPTLEAISTLMEKENKFARFLKVEVPYHSYVMDSILDEFRQCLSGISPQAGSIPVVSTVTGEFIDGRKIDADYWARNVRQTVLFEAAITCLIKNGFNTFIEISSHPVLKASMMECLDAQGGEGFIVSSLKRMEDEEISIRGALGQLYTIGYPIDWRLIYPDRTDFIKLPSYKWQRENYWRESEETMRQRLGWSSVSSDSLQDSQKNPLLGGRIKTAAFVWNSNIDLNHLSYLKDHVVQKSIVFPGAAYVEMALNAADDIYGEPGCSLENLEIKAPLILSEEKPATVQLVVREDRYFDIYGKQAPGDSDWTLHANGRFGNAATDVPGRISLEDIRARCRRKKTRDDCYQEFAARGLEYGENFRGIESLRMGTDEALSEIRIHAEMEAELDRYVIHPVVLDAAFQTLASIQTNRTYLPVHLRGIRPFTKPSGRIFCHARLLAKTKNAISGAITLFDNDGNIIADVADLTCRLVRELRDTFDDNINKLLYEYEWTLDLQSAGNARGPLETILPSPSEIAERIHPVLPELIQKYSRRRYYESVEPEFNRLCTSYIADALDKLGLAMKQGDSFDINDLGETLGIIPEHMKALGRFLDILSEDNLLRKEQNRWTVHAEPDRDYRHLWNGILRKYPEYHTELQLLDRCASRLADILKGQDDPLSYIFSKSSPAVDQFYRNSPTMRIYNTLVQRTMGNIIDAMPKEGTLRILEIGAGTGSLTSYLLPILPANRTRYFFTDISGAFTMQAQQRFKDYDFVEYKILDIEKDPTLQGFDPHAFDIVLASDAIHATSRLNRTMANVKNLLAPSGLLIFIEQMKITRWFDLVFGLLSGWWLFSDHDIRPTYPLMPMNTWKKLLEETGFTDVTFLPSNEEEFVPQHSVMVALAPEKTGQSVRQESAVPDEAKNKKWIILADEMRVAEKLADRLRRKGAQPVLVVPGSSYSEKNPLRITVQPDQPDQYSTMLDGICRDKDIPVVMVNMWSITKPQADIGVDFLEHQSTGLCMRTLYLMQALMKRDWTAPPSLWNMTNGVQPVEHVKKPALEKSPVWGLNRVLISEHPGIQTRMLDLSPDPDEREMDFLCEQLWNPDDEDEIVIRGQRRYVHRLKRKDYPGFHEVTDMPFVAGHSPTKSPEGLHFFETTRRKPERGEVEIKIAAAGVNFKDVALLTGLLDDSVLADKGTLPPLGLECSGTIVAIGEGVNRFRIGDEVMGLGVNCFANYVTLDERVLAHQPEKITGEDAATIPLAFLSAYYALTRSAKIQKGERVLIHTATGGVGLAAVQMALAASAEVLATAGTPEKRDFLKSMGIKYVGDSRTLTFAGDVMSYTGGEGVDVILNTLAENTLEKNMSVLKPVTGRFIDLSNIYRRSVRIYSMDNGIAYHTFDMDSMIKRYPAMAGEMLEKIAAGFSDNMYYPIPYTVYPVSELPGALASMRKGLHTGKIVVSMTEPGVVAVPTGRTIPVDSDSTYLLTGGLGGFGLAVAQWLADCGARHLVLVGRSGASRPEARDTIEKLKRQGVRVSVESLDISKEKDVKDLFNRMDDTMPPLKGVIHMAMVLEDSFLAEMNEVRMKKVMNPKILGAWNLHMNTIDKPLDFFICFSSFASLVGNTDQGNYVAANVFLDLLSTYRRNMNLPALTVCWGPIGDVGYVAQRSDIREHFRRQGFDEVGLDQAWQIIALGIRYRLDTVGIAPADWNSAARYNPSIGTSPRYSRLVKLSEKTRDSGPGTSRIVIHSAMTAEERTEKLTEVLSKEVAGLLGLPVSRLDISQSLAAIGFDSLMAVELVMRIEDVTGIKIPKMKLLKAGLNTTELVTLVDKEIRQAGNAGAEKSGEAASAKPDDIPLKVDALSDQEVDNLLMTMLSEQEGKNEK